MNLKFLFKKVLLHLKAKLISSNWHEGEADNYKYKWNRLLKFSKLYKASIFVETGTYYGLTIDMMKPYFENLHSIEVDHFFFENNKDYFKKDKNVQIHFGDSKNVLPTLLSQAQFARPNSTILFWLDGHCSENETGIGEEYSPLFFELTTIKNHYNDFRAVIIIDDYRLFDGKNYPTIIELRNVLTELHYDFHVDRDAVIFIDKRISA